ncbi:MAG: hypothetical protein H0U95_10805 [Bacteroidetes bacterium]|nr:hypothetical protein [Bacteroidota bacterium]
MDFFELCRGYGISIGFMLLGLVYLQDYFGEKKIRTLTLSSICWQLAVGANLILVITFALILLFIFIFQLKNKLFFSIKNFLLLTVNYLLLFFWIKFSFFYRDHGSLDSGIGDDYWQVSFKSLMVLIYGTDYIWMQGLLVCVFLVILLFSIFNFFRSRFWFDTIFKPQFFYLIIFSSLIIIFYLQKKILNVNYPEDRTGLFFYLLFALQVVFFFDFFLKKILPTISITFISASIIYFIISFNVTNFSYWFYHVIPKKIYSHLENEYKKDPRLFTIGGISYREMNYAFMNYRAKSHLNLMNTSEAMQMNCDYYFASKEEKPYYNFFYDEIDYDEIYDRVLLKRKQKIERIEKIQFSIASREFKGNNEWFEFIRFNDKELNTRSCIEADLKVNFKNVPKPFKAWLVLQINDVENNILYYKKIPFNWIGDDLNGHSHHFKLTSGPLSEKFANANVHIWNVDKEEVEFSISDLKIYELKAPGINMVIPKEYYSLIRDITKKRLF